MAEGSTVLVSNISPQLEEHHLKELFECCGAITSLQLNKALGQCQVSFADSTHARAAVFLSGTTLGDRPLTVSAYQPPPPRQLPPQMSPWASGVPPPVGTPGLIPNPYGGAMNPMGGMQADNEKKQQEIARTVYVGNVNCDLTHEQLSDFFHQNCGPTNIVKLAGETTGKPSRFAFIEFCNVDAAGKALLLDGAPLAGLPLKVRKANNAILKPTNTPAAAQPAQKDMSEIMKRVLAHTTNLGAKLEPKRRSRSRDRDRSRRDRSRDRDRDRSRRRRRSSRSRSRPRDRSRRGRGGARGEDAGAGAGNANALLPPSRVTAETPQTAISRQATELLMKQRSLDGLSFPGGFALEDVLQMVDFASGTPRAGTPLASALAASGLNGLNELALPAIPSLKTGFTPRAGSSIEEIWRQFSERGGDPGDAQPPPPVPEGGMAPGAPPGLLPVHTMAIRPGAAEVLPLPGSVEAAADLSQVNELPVSPSARRRYQAAARAARRSKRKPVSTGPDKRAAAVKRPAANVDAEGDEDDDEDEPTQKKRCIAEPTARVLNNRASARRSRERKLQYVVDLENQVENLKSELADVKQQLAEALGRNRRK